MRTEIKLSEINKEIDIYNHFYPNDIVGNTHEVAEVTDKGYIVNFLLDPGISGVGHYTRRLLIEKEWLND